MKQATAQAHSHQIFEHAGRRYRWVEGATHPSASRFRGRRGELRSLLTRSVIPSQQRRGAVHEQIPALDGGRAWWVTWRCSGEAAVWALYCATAGESANDGARLAAWGDGPVIAWADEDAVIRGRLREALQRVPGFLAEGVCSADETFAVRLTAA